MSHTKPPKFANGQTLRAEQLNDIGKSIEELQAGHQKLQDGQVEQQSVKGAVVALAAVAVQSKQKVSRRRLLWPFTR